MSQKSRAKEKERLERISQVNRRLSIAASNPYGASESQAAMDAAERLQAAGMRVHVIGGATPKAPADNRPLTVFDSELDCVHAHSDQAPGMVLTGRKLI